MIPPDQSPYLPESTLYIGYGGHQVAVTSDAPEVVANAAAAFSDMLEATPTHVVGRITVARQGDVFCLSGGYEAPPVSAPLTTICQQLTNEVMIVLIHAREDLLWFHAGAAASGGRAVILPGMSGRGKSTLTATLCLRGWMYLSDELAPIDRATLMLNAFPQQVMVRHDWGHDVPQEQLATLPKTAAPPLQSPSPTALFPIRAIMLPAFKRDSGAQVTPLSPAIALIELLESCLNFPGHGVAGEAAMQMLHDLVQRAPAYTVTFSDGERAAT